MLIQAISAVNPDWHSLIHKTCALISGGCTENLIQINARIDALERKIEQLVDGYLSGDISKETMCALSERYKTQIQALQSRKKTMDTSKTNNDQLEDFLKEILEGKQVSKAFCQGVLDRITVYQDRHVDLTLKDLPIIFRYQDSDT
jgi:hypothetical protein